MPSCDTDFIYQHKTADLFVAAAAMGAYAGGGSATQVDSLRAYALNLGLAFQHEDDLIDGDSPFPEDVTKAKVADFTAAALNALHGLPGDVEPLVSLAKGLVGRSL